MEVTYGAILLKFEKQHFYMYTNNNRDYNLEMWVHFEKSIYIFLFGTILIKFEWKHFHMFTINI